MTKCDYCGKDVSMPYKCQRCNKNYCSTHRLPEKHTCPRLKRGGKNGQQIINDINNSKKRNIKNEVSKLMPHKLRNYTSGNMWAVFLFIIGVTYLLQFMTLILFNQNIHNTLFVLQSNKLEYVWTIITSIFAHSPNSLMHIIGNGIILLFFGRILEKYIGTKKFVTLFIISGAIAGLSQILFGVLMGDSTTGVLGASGSLSAVLGVLTVYNPKMKVYLYFIIPVSLWIITLGYVVFSIVAIASLGEILGGTAHIAHLIGLLIGLVYGYKTKNNYNIPSKIKRI